VIPYVDSEYPNDRVDRKSVTGYVTCINETPIMWKTKKQSIVTLSSTEAEYVGMTMMVIELIWLFQILIFVNMFPQEKVTLGVDNQSAIKIAKNPKQHGRTKHIDVLRHFIREKISDGILNLKYVQTDEMVADIFTKNLGRTKFEKFRGMIMDNLHEGRMLTITKDV